MWRCLNRTDIGGGKVRTQTFNSVPTENRIEVYDFIVDWKYWSDDPGITAEEVVEALDEMTGDLELRINSQGGEIGATLAISTRIREYRKGHTTSIVDGYAFSSAGWLTQCCQTRKIATGGSMMIHNPMVWAEISKPEDAESALNHWNVMRESIADVFTSRNEGLTADEVYTLMAAETWLSATDALERGFFDELHGEEAKVAAFNCCLPESMPEALRPKKPAVNVEGMMAQRQRMLANWPVG